MITFCYFHFTSHFNSVFFGPNLKYHNNICKLIDRCVKWTFWFSKKKLFSSRLACEKRISVEHWAAKICLHIPKKNEKTYSFPKTDFSSIVNWERNNAVVSRAHILSKQKFVYFGLDNSFCRWTEIRSAIFFSLCILFASSILCVILIWFWFFFIKKNKLKP